MIELLFVIKCDASEGKVSLELDVVRQLSLNIFIDSRDSVTYFDRSDLSQLLQYSISVVM